MSSYKKIFVHFCILTLSYGLELPITAQNETELEPIHSIQQNHTQDNNLTVQEKNSFTNKSDLSNNNNEIDNNNKSERQVTPSQELTHKSVVNTKLGDDRILAILAEALNVIKSPKCYKDLNYTIDAIRKQRPWAIASKFVHIFIKNRNILFLHNINIIIARAKQKNNKRQSIMRQIVV